MHRDDAETDLVAHDDRRAPVGAASARVRRRDRSVEDRVDGGRTVAKQRAEPERQAVDQDRLGRLGRGDGRRKVAADVDRRPLGRALRPVPADPVVELRVAGSAPSRGTTRGRLRRDAASSRGRTGSCRCGCHRGRGSAGSATSAHHVAAGDRARDHDRELDRARPCHRRRGRRGARRRWRRPHSPTISVAEHGDRDTIRPPIGTSASR